MMTKIKIGGCLVAIGVLFFAPVTFAATTFFEVHSSVVDAPFWGRGDGFSIDRVAQQYTAQSAQTVCSVAHQIVAFSHPTDSAQLAVYSGGASPEAGSRMATSSLAASALPASTGSYATFTLNPCLAFATGATYWFVFSRTVPATGNGYISAYRPSNEYSYSSYWQYNQFDPQGWQQNTSREWSLRLSGPELAIHEPVVIVPGILGTRLNQISDGQEIWPDGSTLLQSQSDSQLDALALNAGGAGGLINPSALVDSILSKHVYDNLINAFVDAGYASGTDLFTVPYDWRLDLASSTNRLDSVIKSAVAKSPTGKVNIVAHSLGGLLVKEYTRQVGNAAFVNRLILAGVPELGSPKAFKALQYGDTFGFSFGPVDILNPSRIKSIAQNMPAVYQLLPSQSYVASVGRYIVDYVGLTGLQLNYPQSRDFMLRDARDSRNSALLDRADGFHQALDPIGFNLLPDSIYRIVGCQNPATLGDVRVYAKNKFDMDPIDGDGTVPLRSATFSLSGHTYAALYSQTGIDHLGLVTDNRTVHLIRDLILSTSTPQLSTGVSANIADCNTAAAGPHQKTILVSTHSPVALNVYDSQNRQTGPNASGDIELGIPESSYEQVGDNSFVFLPAGETYRVVTQATDSGSFDLKIKSFTGLTQTSLVTYLAVPLASAQTTAQFTVVDPTAPPVLQLDRNGDGTVDDQIPATAMLTDALAADATPPTITITSPVAKIYARSASVPLSMTIADDESGLASSSLALDGRLISSSGTIDQALLTLGAHTLTVTAYDRAGNPATTVVQFQVAVTSDNLSADIDAALASHWLRPTTVADTLKQQLATLSTADFFVAVQTAHNRCQLADPAYTILKQDTEQILNY